MAYRTKNTRRRLRGGDPAKVVKQYGELVKHTEAKEVVGCFMEINEDDVEKNNPVMIVGPRFPKQTEVDYRDARYPYEECLFFFRMSFPPAYPAVSPQLIFQNAGLFADNFRYHPNLYETGQGVASGKVCLSILGTWAGPGWLPTMSITSVLETVQSILGSNPLHNEPGNEARLANDPILKAYNHAACYRSIKFTVDIYEMVFEKSDDKLPEIIRPFVAELRSRAFTALRFFQRKLVNIKKHHPHPFTNPIHIHHREMTIDYDSLSDKILALSAKIPDDLAKELDSDDIAVKTLEDARKEEEEARRMARMQCEGINIPHGVKRQNNATKRNAPKSGNNSNMNSQIKELENSIRALEVSGDNVRGLRTDLAILKRKRNGTNKVASPKGKANKNNNNNSNENIEYEYNDE